MTQKAYYQVRNCSSVRIYAVHFVTGTITLLVSPVAGLCACPLLSCDVHTALPRLRDAPEVFVLDGRWASFKVLPTMWWVDGSANIRYTCGMWQHVLS